MRRYQSAIFPAALPATLSAPLGRVLRATIDFSREFEVHERFLLFTGNDLGMISDLVVDVRPLSHSGAPG